jgi:hypothetical protein
MRPEVQVLPGPLLALTSRMLVVSSAAAAAAAGGRGVFGIKTSYLVTVPGHESALLSSNDYGSSVERDGGGHPVYGDTGEGGVRA